MPDNFTVRDFQNGTPVPVRATPSVSDPTAKRVHHFIEGHQVVDPSQMLNGHAATTDTADHELLAMPFVTGDPNNRLYVTGVQVKNSGATAALITLKNGSGGATLGFLYVPAGGSDEGEYWPVPLILSTETSLYFAADHASSTISASAQGYKAS